MREAFERQLAEHGRDSLERSRASIEKRLAEHVRKLSEIRSAGGYTSSVESEIRTFEAQLAAINEILEKHQ